MFSTIDTVLEIDTPEHLAFRTRIAGPGRRFFAWLIDQLVWGLMLATIFAFVQIVGGAARGLSTGVLLIVLFVLYWFYFVGWELGTGGRSPGKIALKLRVVRPNGLPITFRESALRNVLRAADILLLPASPGFLIIAPVVMAFDPKFRRLGDMVAGSIVVIEERAKISSTPEVAEDPATLAELPPRLPLDRHDLEALELWVSRPHMSDARRRELADKVAGVYARRLSLDAPRDSAAFLATLYARSQDRSRRIDP